MIRNPEELSNNQEFSRRHFIDQSVKTVGALTLMNLAAIPGNALHVNKQQLTVQDIIDLILKEGGLKPLKDTVDTLKSGKPNQVVTGIVTTMFATIPVIEAAVKRNANFIIAHEPTFYNHKDDTDWVKNNSVTKQKQQLLARHKMVVWRFHDYCHAFRPDAVSHGFAKKMNWLSYYKSDEVMLTVPAITLSKLVGQLKSALAISHVRVIGDLSQSCRKIALLPGAWGGQRQVSVVETEKPDVIIVGETSEWETVEYIRDSQSFGGKTALIVLGHAVSEEPGMEGFVDWLQPKLPGLKVAHIASKDPFIWL